MTLTGDEWGTASAVLRLAAQLTEGIQRGLASRGFNDVRPAHGFLFAKISAHPATAGEIAEHLGVTKQAAAQLVDQLERLGYVRRQPDPQDARARRVLLTPRGRACTRAAEQAAADTVNRWKTDLDPDAFHALQQALLVLALPGPLRPVW